MALCATLGDKKCHSRSKNPVIPACFWRESSVFVCSIT
jgi:hypothetical protein